jgi:hypothetical protein
LFSCARKWYIWENARGGIPVSGAVFPKIKFSCARK